MTRATGAGKSGTEGGTYAPTVSEVSSMSETANSQETEESGRGTERECHICGATDTLIYRVGGFRNPDSQIFECATGCNP